MLKLYLQVDQNQENTTEFRWRDSQSVRQYPPRCTKGEEGRHFSLLHPPGEEIIYRFIRQPINWERTNPSDLIPGAGLPTLLEEPNQ